MYNCLLPLPLTLEVMANLLFKLIEFFRTYLILIRRVRNFYPIVPHNEKTSNIIDSSKVIKHETIKK